WMASAVMCAALLAHRKRVVPSSTVFTALKHGSASRCALSSPTATIAFYANGRNAQTNAPVERAESGRGILHRAKVHLPDSIPGGAGAKNPDAPAVKRAAEE